MFAVFKGVNVCCHSKQCTTLKKKQYLLRAGFFICYSSGIGGTFLFTFVKIQDTDNRSAIFQA